MYEKSYFGVELKIEKNKSKADKLDTQINNHLYVSHHLTDVFRKIIKNHISVYRIQ